jgi:hypothetical protein
MVSIMLGGGDVLLESFELALNDFHALRHVGLRLGGRWRLLRP